MSELAYSLHLGSDKNRKNISKQNGKNHLSGTTSLPNNAIQNVRQLSKVDKHNYRKYDNEQELIEIVRGTSSPLDDVKELYLIEFEEARLAYNSKQSRPSRMIDNYFDNVSNNEKKDLACEIILELGDKEYWDTKDENFKKKMSEVYKKQVDDLELLVPNFKVASAIIHYDETSPHLHIVGVPIKYKNKNGMEKQVGKSDVFTKESLIRLQDKMRTLCIEEFNQVYSLDSTLKKKQKGRNRDIHVSDMDNYFEMIDEDCLNNYINVLKKQKTSKLSIIDLLISLSKNNNITNEMYNKFFYSIRLNEHDFRDSEYLKILEISKTKLELDNVNNYNKFLNYINYYCQRFDDYYLENLKKTDLKNNIVSYKNYLDKCGKIYTDGMKLLDDYSRENTVFGFSKNIREQFYKNGYYQYYVISTRLNENFYEIEDDKFDNLSERYVSEYEYRKNWKCKVGNNMKQYLYKNVNMSKLDESRLILFNDLPQRVDIIESVLNTNNDVFINKYLSKINKINVKDIKTVFKLLGEYNRNKGLKKSTKSNLKTLTKNKECLQQLDARRKILEFV